MNNPIGTKMAVNFRRNLVGSGFSPTTINCDTNIEFMKIATKSDEPKTTDKVIGKKIINCPITPGQVPSGTKAATVVAVEIIIGIAISPIPFFAAFIREIFSVSMSR